MKVIFAVLVIACSFTLVYAQQSRLSPNAKYIDCGAMEPFKEGFAVVRRGRAVGIIDPRGNFLVPYGTYENIPYGFVNGLCMVLALPDPKGGGQLYGFIDKTGKLVIPCIHMTAENFDEGGHANVQKYVKPGVIPLIIDRQGKELKIVKRRNAACDPKSGMCIGHDGISDRVGNLILPLKIEAYSKFSEGLLAVAKQNEFGDIKWGFIDPTGKTIIPFQYTNKPHDFSDGLALVTPVNNDEFQYAYINRSGEIVIKVKETSIIRAGSMQDARDFEKNSDKTGAGMSKRNNSNTLLDRQGNIYGLNEMLKEKGATFNTNEAVLYEVRNGFVRFRVKGYGICDTDGNILIQPDFTELGHFDPVSRLALGHIYEGGKLVEGYVNQQGYFTLVKGPKSQF